MKQVDGNRSVLQLRKAPVFTPVHLNVEGHCRVLLRDQGSENKRRLGKHFSGGDNDLAVGSQVDSLDLRLDTPLHSRFVEMELENLLLLVLLDAKRGHHVSRTVRDRYGAHLLRLRSAAA